MDMIALILSVIGCINWGLVGLFRFDLVAWLFGGSGSLISRILYTLVGLAGLWCITFFFRKAAFRDAAYGKSGAAFKTVPALLHIRFTSHGQRS